MLVKKVHGCQKSKGLCTCEFAVDGDIFMATSLIEVPWKFHGHMAYQRNEHGIVHGRITHDMEIQNMEISVHGAMSMTLYHDPFGC